MAGLLDFLNSPAGQGLLGVAAGTLAGGGRTAGQNIGRGLLTGLQTYGNAQDNQWQNEQRQWQRDQMQKQKSLDSLAPQFFRSPTQTALSQGAQAGSIGPTMANASRLPSAQPSFDTEGYLKARMAHDPIGTMQLQASMAKDTPFAKVDPKDYTPESVAKFSQSRNFADLQPARRMEFVNGQAVDPYNVAPGTRIDNIDPNKPFNMVGGQIVPNSAFQSFDLTRARAGAANNSVSINTGQKGLDNEFKLRGEFKGEPVYKAHQEMQAAYSQIQQSLKQASPAGDLAGATKIMKLLDPGSVVRESELGMAMAASGALDRLQHYAQNVMNGTKLTPTQRADFQRLADSLYGESVKQYNAKRAEYQRLGGEYELNADRALGPGAAMPSAPSDGWSIKPKGSK